MSVVILFLFLSVFFGLLRGGKIERLLSLEIAYWWLMVVALLLQALLAYTPRQFNFPMLILSYLLLIFALSRNKASLGIVIIAVGVFLNFAVIALNHGMPVALETARRIGFRGSRLDLAQARDGIHVLLTKQSLLPWLGDVIPVAWLRTMLSPGDILLNLGVFFVIQEQMKYKGRHRL